MSDKNIQKIEINLKTDALFIQNYNINIFIIKNTL